MDSAKLVLALLDEGYEKKTWHGPNLKQSIKGVTAKQAAWRPGPGRHNIWEVMLHAAYWKYAVRRRLAGEKRGSFALEGSNWFNTAASRGWKDDVRLLVGEHRKLRAAIAAFPASALGRPVDAKKQTAAYTIRGIAAHDLYHAGQIQLLKKLLIPNS